MPLYDCSQMVGLKKEAGTFLTSCCRACSPGTEIIRNFRKTGCNLTDRGVQHDLDGLGTLLLAQLSFGGYHLAMSHDLSHVDGDDNVDDN